MRRFGCFFAALLLVCLSGPAALAQTRFDHKHEKEDNPAAFAQWFMKSRTPRNTRESAASLLQKATAQKMQLRAQHLQRVQASRKAGVRYSGGVADANSVWTSLGPSPIVWGNSVSQSWTGRITAVAVDQTDATGNTVVIGGAYGGVWRSINAATTNSANITWTSLTDDQASLSIGAVAIQPGNGSTILAGTGEPNGALDSYYGMGILVSTNTGGSWTLVQQTSDSTPVTLSSKAISGIAFNTAPAAPATSSPASPARARAREPTMVSAARFTPATRARTGSPPLSATAARRLPIAR